MKAHAIQMDAPGGPEVLTLREVDVPAPGPGEVQLRQTVCGVNFLDIYQRSGSYSMPMPMGAGNEAAGVVTAVGEGVTGIAVGDRAAYQGGTAGAYATLRNIPAWRAVKLPDSVSDEDAAASMLKGMTAEYLLDRCAHLSPGDHALMYAAAGGVGLLAGQWAKARGIRLIGVASGPEKCALAMANGYAEMIDRRTDDIVARVKDITGGKGVPVVFDSIGKTTFETTLDCLSPMGLFVSFGASSGKPPAIEASTLQTRGSLFFTRPTLVNYCGTPELYALSARKVVDALATGTLRPVIGHRLPLAEAARAQAELEAGRTTGATLLIA